MGVGLGSSVNLLVEKGEAKSSPLREKAECTLAGPLVPQCKGRQTSASSAQKVQTKVPTERLAL